ncbi:hypothetical protein, partial [Saccharopolyspora sp. NPDC003762]
MVSIAIKQIVDARIITRFSRRQGLFPGSPRATVRTPSSAISIEIEPSISMEIADPRDRTA